MIENLRKIRTSKTIFLTDQNVQSDKNGGWSEHQKWQKPSARSERCKLEHRKEPWKSNIIEKDFSYSDFFWCHRSYQNVKSFPKYGPLNNQNVKSIFNRFLATTYSILPMDTKACGGSNFLWLLMFFSTKWFLTLWSNFWFCDLFDFWRSDHP